MSPAEHLGTPFAQFLLSVVEDGLPSDAAEQLPDLCTNLLLALNLHLPGGGGRRGARQPGSASPARLTLTLTPHTPLPPPLPAAPEQNVVMAALGKHANVKVFSEKLLLLLNRGGEAPGCADRGGHSGDWA